MQVLFIIKIIHSYNSKTHYKNKGEKIISSLQEIQKNYKYLFMIKILIKLEIELPQFDKGHLQKPKILQLTLYLIVKE